VRDQSECRHLLPAISIAKGFAGVLHFAASDLKFDPPHGFAPAAQALHGMPMPPSAMLIGPALGIRNLSSVSYIASASKYDSGAIAEAANES